MVNRVQNKDQHDRTPLFDQRPSQHWFVSGYLRRLGKWLRRLSRPFRYRPGDETASRDREFAVVLSLDASILERRSRKRTTPHQAEYVGLRRRWLRTEALKFPQPALVGKGSAKARWHRRDDSP